MDEKNVSQAETSRLQLDKIIIENEPGWNITHENIIVLNSIRVELEEQDWLMKTHGIFLIKN